MAGKSGVPGALRRVVMREGGYACAECGLRGFEVSHGNGNFTFHTAIERVYLSIDHIVPRSRGGTSERSNLRVLCTPCNTKKGTKLLLLEAPP